jgi:hypothetical protein
MKPRAVAASPRLVSAVSMSAAAARPPVSAAASVPLRYIRQGGIVVRGPVSGRQYSFTAAGSIQLVGAQDAAALLRTSWFRRV